MIDALVVLLLIALMGLAAGGFLVWDARRRLRRRFSRTADRALDELAVDTCDGLARGGDGGRAARRYARSRDELRDARGLRELARAAARAEGSLVMTRVETGLRRFSGYARRRGPSR